LNQSSVELTSQERETRAAYYRAWRAKNKDKVKTYNQRYWQKRTAQKREAADDGKTDS
jgi:hypothetical protein